MIFSICTVRKFIWRLKLSVHANTVQALKLHQSQRQVLGPSTDSSLHLHLDISQTMRITRRHLRDGAQGGEPKPAADQGPVPTGYGHFRERRRPACTRYGGEGCATI